MKRFGTLILGALMVSAIPLIGQTSGDTQAPSKPQGQGQSKPVSAAHTDRGQQVFDQNCARCHNAPEGFSPHISGTIAMHMRVRANLSAADYEALRRFLNP
jgi:cytochrome c5